MACCDFKWKRFLAFIVCILCVAIHKTLSSILQLGNIQFVQDKTSDQAALPDNTGNLTVMCTVYC